jgi:hypothetical protein
MIGQLAFFDDEECKCSKAKLVLNWSRQNQINVMKWPAQSADLNPIENLWAVIVAKLRLRKLLRSEVANCRDS